MDRNSFLIGLLVGVVIYFLFTKLVRPQVSESTIQPFEGMTDRAAVQASLKNQVTAIVTEMTTALKTAKQENKTIDRTPSPGVGGLVQQRAVHFPAERGRYWSDADICLHGFLRRMSCYIFNALNEAFLR